MVMVQHQWSYQRWATKDPRPTTYAKKQRPMTNNKNSKQLQGPTIDDQDTWPMTTSHQPPITNHQSPITNHQPLTTSHRQPTTYDQWLNIYGYWPKINQRWSTTSNQQKHSMMVHTDTYRQTPFFRVFVVLIGIGRPAFNKYSQYAWNCWYILPSPQKTHEHIKEQNCQIESSKLIEY